MVIAGCNAVFGLDGVRLDGDAADAAPGGDGGGVDATPSCGDDHVDPPDETCDDGNTMPGDGCSANCHLEIGCADGAREGFDDPTTWPRLAACAGGWTVPGIDTPAVSVAECDGIGDDSVANAAGTGCAAANLCAAGWHVCVTSGEVVARLGAGSCDTQPSFFATRQPATLVGVCAATGPGVAGCGSSGELLTSCGPLGVHAGADCSMLAGDSFACTSGMPRTTLTHGDVVGGVLCCAP